MSAPPSALRLMTASQLGQLLVTSRKRHKLTQAEVGHRVGLSQNRISYLEKNADEISFGQLLRWCAVIGLALHLGERKGVASTDISEW
ncbi:helix-turn-helix domain-containing protein [Robbsia andropogonis]|uniref:helix-turn-helix domain-containing protein n=1 Tax=Robbsia andropogonis TaxID=28092 RepID=UPI000464F297|nr:helix-turn-helix domain-containing protein [Robbsia andropogonis]MCP1120783.1 helix-turn-helix domain-containing protein [Robbsia andropogonis]MCP1130542.1 helix-turn-helix domain-containing protein [Robbsia andropogonis]